MIPFAHLTRRSGSARAAGFSLIEMMVVVALIGIVSAYGFSSWKEATLKGKRKEAEATLLTGAQYMERYYSAYGSYSTTPAPAPFASVTSSNYAFTASVSATGYTLTATPKTADANCGNLTINQAGVKTESGSQSVSYCW